MARTWHELFDSGDEAPPAPGDSADGGDEPRRGFFRRLRDNMRTTREALGAELQASVFQSLDASACSSAGLPASLRDTTREIPSPPMLTP